MPLPKSPFKSDEQRQADRARIELNAKWSDVSPPFQRKSRPIPKADGPADTWTREKLEANWHSVRREIAPLETCDAPSCKERDAKPGSRCPHGMGVPAA